MIRWRARTWYSLHLQFISVVYTTLCTHSLHVPCFMISMLNNNNTERKPIVWDRVLRLYPENHFWASNLHICMLYAYVYVILTSKVLCYGNGAIKLLSATGTIISLWHQTQKELIQYLFINPPLTVTAQSTSIGNQINFIIEQCTVIFSNFFSFVYAFKF